MNTILLARLLLVHVIGDFLLQSDRSIAIRNEKNFASPYLYLHGSIHFVLAWIACWNWQAWWVALVIGAGHIIFDGVKAKLKKTNLIAFLIDQAAHLLVIVSCWLMITNAPVIPLLKALSENKRICWIVLGYTTVIILYSRLVAIATTPWRKFIPPEREMLQNAGRWIGIIERSLVFTFILINQFFAVGFLLAAKSVFRFGDLRESKDKGHTEYVMIGTLLSFGLTILTGLFIQRMIRQ